MIGKLRLKNFNNHEDTEITFARLNIILGLNNSGKSSILEGIRLALLGHSDRFKDTGRDPEDTGEVELTWTGIGDIRRTVNPRSLQVGEWTGGKTAQQAALCEALGVGPKTLEALLSSYRFIDMDTADQKAMLFALLGIEFSKELIREQFAKFNDGDTGPYDRVKFVVKGEGAGVIDKLHKAAFDARRDANKELERLKGLPISEAPEVDVSKKAEWESLIITLKADRDRLLESIPSKSQEALNNQVISGFESKIEKNNSELKKLNIDTDNYSELEEQRTTITTQKETVRAEIKAGDRSRDKLEGQIEALESTLKQLEKFKGKCLVLSSVKCPISEDEIGKMQTSTKAKISKLKKKYTPVVISLKENEERRTELRSELDEVDGQISDIESSRSRGVILRNNNKELMESLKSAREQVAKQPDVVNIRKEIAAIDERIARGNSVINKMEAFEANKGDAEKHTKNLVVAKQRVADLETLVAAYGPQGVKKAMLSDKLGSIENRANEMLEVLTGGKYQIYLMLNPDFHIMVMKTDPENRLKGGKTIPLYKLSKSEKLRIGIILQDALNQLTEFKLLVIDDADTLIGSNRVFLSNFATTTLDRGDYEQIIIISSAEIRDADGNIKPELFQNGDGAKRILIEDGAAVGSEIPVCDFSENIKLLAEEWSPEKKAEFMDEWRMLHGFPPHNDCCNTCYGDGYFLNSLTKKYDMTEEEMLQAFKFIEDGQVIKADSAAVAV